MPDERTVHVVDDGRANAYSGIYCAVKPRRQNVGYTGLDRASFVSPEPCPEISVG
jgi:hypothetical protein